MRYLLVFVLSLFFVTISQAQWKTKDPVQFQQELNEWYKNEETSPFKDEKLRLALESLNYFSINNKYKINGVFHRLENGKIQSYPTSSGEQRELQEYGYVEFAWKKTTCKLYILEEIVVHNPEFADFVEIPFYDATNTKQTYGGGRYLGLWKNELKDGQEIMLDFNLAFNPYCAYVKGYSCLIPPEKNRLDFKVKAGVKQGINLDSVQATQELLTKGLKNILKEKSE